MVGDYRRECACDVGELQLGWASTRLYVIVCGAVDVSGVGGDCVYRTLGGRWRGEGGLAGLAHRTVAAEEHVGTRDAPDEMPVRLPSLDRSHPQYLPY